jgi:hypothetical protein
MSERNSSEIWRDVPGFPKLKASSFGRIIGAGGSILSPNVHKTGYLTFNTHADGRRQKLYVHRVVATAFLGLQTGQTVNHMDGDKQNNAPSNLEVLGYPAKAGMPAPIAIADALIGRRENGAAANNFHGRIHKWIRAIVRAELKKLLAEKQPG